MMDVNGNIEISLELMPSKTEKEDKKTKKLRRRSSLWNTLTQNLFTLQVYKVLVRSGDKNWFIFRRYNEFYNLHEKVSYNPP